MSSALHAGLVALARLWPFSVSTDESLDRDLAFLNLPFDSALVLGAGFGAGAVTATFVCLVAAALGVGVIGAGLAGAAAGVGTIHGVHRGPAALAAVERTRALCAASDLIGRVVLRARLSAALEPAAAFAARTDDGPLARSLDDHVRRASGSPGSGLGTFAAAWRPWFPALERAVELVETAVDAPPDEREALFDEALAVGIDATEERMRAFSTELKGPVTAIYAFGVLLPLALVGILPAASVAGASISLAQLALAYDVLLPLALVGAAGWLLVRRPVTFARPSVSRRHLDDTSWWQPLLAGGSTACIFWVAASSVVGAWAAPPSAVGAGFGAGLVVAVRPAMDVRRRAREVEDGLPEALSLVGRRVRTGTSVEAAVAAVGTELSGETGALFVRAADVQRRLGTTLGEAFVGEFGALRQLPSPRCRAAATLLSVATIEGRPAGDTLVSLADQLRALDRAEQAGRRALAPVSQTLVNTAAVFGPLVGGATVTLAARIAAVETGSTVGMTFSVPGLGTVLNCYVFVMATTLTALATGLESGLDRTHIGYRVGIALVLAATMFLVGVVAADLLV